MPIKSRMSVVKSLVGALSDRQERTSLLRAVAANKRLPSAECSCCGYVGKFLPAGLDARLGQLCPKCKSYERHRLIALALQRKFLNLEGKDVVHFAPEAGIRPLILQEEPTSYVTADIEPGRADLVLDLEQIDLPDASCDVAIASHVLEHVDDRKTLAELNRIIKPGGQVIALVPIVEGWSETFEDSSLTSREDRQDYFGRFDHVRYYGADFRERIRQAGFDLAEFTAGPIDSVRYRLSRGEKVFLATKSA